jgi:hypothetical protein
VSAGRNGGARVWAETAVILELLASGALTLTSVRLLQPHLTDDNHQAVLARAANARREKIEALVAELAPKPDVVASVRKLPVARTISAIPTDSMALGNVPVSSATGPASLNEAFSGQAPEEVHAASAPTLRPPPRPVIRATAPERYRVQFTISQQTHDKLRRLQALLRREIPNGDPAVLFDRMVDVYLEQVEKDKLGATKTRRRTPGAGPTGDASGPAYGIRIRPATDKNAPSEPNGRRQRQSRHIPDPVKRAVWRRDGAQCAFVSATGLRCIERNFLEFHHIQPYALEGPATAANISLRCRRHNQYESEVVFGPRSVHETG